jgi:hypothetical protein
MKRRSFLGRVLACAAIPFVGFRREEKPEVFLIDLGGYPSIEIHLYKLRTEVWCDGVCWVLRSEQNGWMVYRGKSDRWGGLVRFRRLGSDSIDLHWFAIVEQGEPWMESVEFGDDGKVSERPIWSKRLNVVSGGFDA